MTKETITLMLLRSLHWKGVDPSGHARPVVTSSKSCSSLESTRYLQGSITCAPAGGGKHPEEEPGGKVKVSPIFVGRTFGSRILLISVAEVAEVMPVIVVAVVVVVVAVISILTRSW